MTVPYRPVPRLSLEDAAGYSETAEASANGESGAPVAGSRYSARPIGSVLRPNADDPGELLRHRLLCRGGGLLLAAPTGVGKSTLAIQSALLWAVGRDCLGLQPARPLRSLYVQAENDDGDLAELRDGILGGCNFTQDEREQACQQVHFVTIDDLCGPEFILCGLAPLLEPDRYDLCYVDPLLAYIGGDVSRQEIVSPFLRNNLNPVIHRAGVGAVIVHHTNKPPSGKEKPDWQAGDLAYVGSGSAELANWARAVVAIRSVGSHEVFELRLGKRGRRAGWKDAEGSPSYSRAIAHGQEGIYWRLADQEEEPGRPGRPPSHNVEDIVALLDGQELTATEWKDNALSELGIAERSFYRLKKEAAKEGVAQQSKISRKWFKAP